MEAAQPPCRYRFRRRYREERMSEPEKESLGRSLAYLPVKVIVRWGICSLIALVGLAIIGLFEAVTRAVTTDPFWMLVVIILLCLFSCPW
jgi:hypothetical protein